MWFTQRVGPFKSGQVIFNKKNVNYLQIGIEHPHSIPISRYENLVSDDEVIIEYPGSIVVTTENDTKFPIIFSLNKGTNQNQRDFVVTEKDIFETRFNAESVIITTSDIKDPYLIINIAYEDAN